jgi:hypothetical protein
MAIQFICIIFMDGSNCFALLHVTTWICIEIDEQLIGIIDD